MMEGSVLLCRFRGLCHQAIVVSIRVGEEDCMNDQP